MLNRRCWIVRVDYLILLYLTQEPIIKLFTNGSACEADRSVNVLIGSITEADGCRIILFFVHVFVGFAQEFKPFVQATLEIYSGIGNYRHALIFMIHPSGLLKIVDASIYFAHSTIFVSFHIGMIGMGNKAPCMSEVLHSVDIARVPSWNVGQSC